MSTIKRLVFNFKTQGLAYFVKAPRNEWTNPRLAFTRGLRRVVIGFNDSMAPRRRVVAWSDDALQFFYDLSVSPTTFDFASGLAYAELVRRRRGFRWINVVIVHSADHQIPPESPLDQAGLSSGAREWRVRHMLVPMLSFLPTVNSYAICRARQHADALMADDDDQIVPEGYRVHVPRCPSRASLHKIVQQGATAWPLLRATNRGRDFIREFLERTVCGRRPIVITLRNYGVQSNRNSNVENWVTFAERLDATIYAPIFILDSETAMRHSPERPLQVCEAASWNVEIRMALYEAAWLNMGLMTGPLELCWYNEIARYLIFMPVSTASTALNYSLRESWRQNGLAVGQSLGFARPWQRIVWCQDDLDVMHREFTAMEELLDGMA